MQVTIMFFWWSIMELTPEEQELKESIWGYVSSTRKNDKDKYTPLLWSKVFAESVGVFECIKSVFF